MNRLLCYSKYLGITRMLNQISEIDWIGGMIKGVFLVLSTFLTGAVLGVVSDNIGVGDKIATIAILISAGTDWFLKLMYHESVDCEKLLYVQPIKRSKVIFFTWLCNFFTWDNFITLIFVCGVCIFSNVTSYVFVAVILLDSILITSLVVLTSDAINQPNLKYKLVCAIIIAIYALLCFVFLKNVGYAVILMLWLADFFLSYILYYKINKYPVAYSYKSSVLFGNTESSIVRIILKQILRTNIKRIVAYNVLWVILIIVSLSINGFFLQETSWMHYLGLYTVLILYTIPFSIFVFNGFMFASQYFDALLCHSSQLIYDFILSLYKMNSLLIACMSIVLYAVFGNLFFISAGIYSLGIIMAVVFLSFIFCSRGWNTIEVKSPRGFDMNSYGIVQAFILVAVVFFFFFVCYQFDYVFANTILIVVGGIGIVLSPVWIKFISRMVLKRKYLISSKYRIK